MSLAYSDTSTKAATRGSLGALVAPINAIFVSRDAARRNSADRAASTSSSLPNPRSRRTHSTSNATMLSVEDYDGLSSSIKKKYFSPAERLHIVQRTASSRRRKRTRADPYRPSSPFQNTDFDIRPATSTGVSLWRRPSQCPEHGDPSALAAALDPDAISEEQARWYLGLPEKIRRQQFTRKEQISLAVRCKRALNDTAPDFADDALRRCLNGRRQDNLDRLTSQRRRQSLATVDTEILIDDVDTLNESQGHRPSDSFATQIEIFSLYANPDPHAATDPVSIPPPPLPVTASAGKPRRTTSFSRAATFTPISLPPPQLAPVPAIPPLPPALHPQSFASPTSWVEVTDNESSLTAQGRMNENRPYQQPDVRKQLRHHLSPEKFDEALEFGFSFPEDREHGALSAAAEQSSPSQPPALCYTSDEGEEDFSDTLEAAGPRTPTTVADNVFPTVMRPSFDSNGRSSLRQPSLTAMTPPKSRSPWGSVGNREMTIHMTLTRRDLLDVERVDPLALEPLPICDDPTGAHGAFAVGHGKNPRGLRRMWNSLRGH
ncbi:hypothetical protein BDY17DRAFT_301315 [Neohortaea acidophila]|uniref:Uncharacterized protein n=1 Tax=Neohortaea acidophila TaxID=245834 RepID=A0A6A6PN44_9PEZI|nr:uncharacterized protein BDY17DRAFT_301315 [Neohortaea acidophila]KAF2481422.1 hypothetical protein BDY17DRAFT_301315 [Neohortaea acidophila]